MRKRSGALDADSLEKYIMVDIRYIYNYFEFFFKRQLAVQTNSKDLNYFLPKIKNMHFGSILTEDLNKLKIEESENLMRESNPEKENFYSLQNGLKEVQLPHHKCLKLMVLLIVKKKNL